ncbi:MAG: hypothetical protein Q4E75_03445 [bacterium]|nr:hypothetical protein [bacterium]
MSEKDKVNKDFYNCIKNYLKGFQDKLSEAYKAIYLDEYNNSHNKADIDTIKNSSYEKLAKKHQDSLKDYSYLKHLIASYDNKESIAVYGNEIIFNFTPIENCFNLSNANKIERCFISSVLIDKFISYIEKIDMNKVKFIKKDTILGKDSNNYEYLRVFTNDNVELEGKKDLEKKKELAKILRNIIGENGVINKSNKNYDYKELLLEFLPGLKPFTADLIIKKTICNNSQNIVKELPKTDKKDFYVEYLQNFITINKKEYKPKRKLNIQEIFMVIGLLRIIGAREFDIKKFYNNIEKLNNNNLLQKKL